MLWLLFQQLRLLRLSSPFATNLCKFSDTSFATTSGQPSWLLLVVSSGRNTCWATADSVSKGASVSSPWATCVQPESLGYCPC